MATTASPDCQPREVGIRANKALPPFPAQFGFPSLLQQTSTWLQPQINVSCLYIPLKVWAPNLIFDRDRLELPHLELLTPYISQKRCCMFNCFFY